MRPWGKEALGRIPSLPRQLCFARLHSALLLSTVLQRHIFCISVPAGGTQSSVRSLSQREADLYRQKSLVPDWSIFMQMRTKFLQFDWSNKKCLGWSERSCSDWSVKMLMVIYSQQHNSDWTAKASVLLVEIEFQDFLHKGWFRWQEHSADGEFNDVPKRPLCRNGCWAMFFKI